MLTIQLFCIVYNDIWYTGRATIVLPNLVSFVCQMAECIL